MRYEHKTFFNESTFKSRVNTEAAGGGASHLCGDLSSVLQPGEFGRGRPGGAAVQPQGLALVDLDVLGADLDLGLGAEAGRVGF